MLEGTITNTFAGSRRGSKWVYTLDENGNRIQTHSLKITVSEDAELHPVLSDDSIAKAS